MLLQGLQVVDRAREWYQKQISAVEDKMRDIGQIGWLPVSSLILLLTFGVLLDIYVVLSAGSLSLNEFVSLYFL